MKATYLGCVRIREINALTGRFSVSGYDEISEEEKQYPNGIMCTLGETRWIVGGKDGLV